jgi:hypothetical protein
MRRANLLQPLRRVVTAFEDRDGKHQLLSCGHAVPEKRGVSSRRCQQCPSEVGPTVTPCGPTALREWMVTRYGWPNASVKDISKIVSWSIDNLRGTRYHTDCHLHVRVLDDAVLLLALGNRDILVGIQSELTAIPQRDAGFEIMVTDLRRLYAIADAVEQLVARRYDVPSFKYVCPRTAQRLRDFAAELATYSPSGAAHNASS